MFTLKKGIIGGVNNVYVIPCALNDPETEIIEKITSSRTEWKKENYEFFGFFKKNYSGAADDNADEEKYQVSYASLDKIIIASENDNNFPGNLKMDSLCFYPIQKYENEKVILNPLASKNNLYHLNWFFYSTKKEENEKKDEDFAFLQEEHAVLDFKKIEQLKTENKFRDLYKYLKPFLKYKILLFREDDLHIAMKTLISCLDHMKATQKYQRWSCFLTYTYKFIYPMYEFAKYARYYSHHLLSYNTVLLLRKLLMFDKDYRPKNNEEILIKDSMLDFEETILASYVCNKQFGLECCIRYMLKKKSNIDNIVQNLQFYVPSMDDYIEETGETGETGEIGEIGEEENKRCLVPILEKSINDIKDKSTVMKFGQVTSWKPFILSNYEKTTRITDNDIKKTTIPLFPYTMHETSSLFQYLDLETVTNVSATNWMCLAKLDKKYYIFIQFDPYIQKPQAICLPFKSDKISKLDCRAQITGETDTCIFLKGENKEFVIYKTCLKFLQV